LALLELAGVSKSFGDHRVLDGVSFSVERGDVVSLIGPSGSGKSTLLRLVIGLEHPEAGRVALDGTVIDYRDRRALRSARDRMAIVFQSYNLFQNMTVLDNVTIAPTRVKRRDAAVVRREAEALLARVGLAGKLRAYPDELSGGQQQRVAIARALAMKPELLLLDEITSALDPELVTEVLDVIRLLARDGMTMLIVSHEMAFVREVASRVVFLDGGRVVEHGPTARLLDAPAHPRVREFMGKILRHGAGRSPAASPPGTAGPGSGRP
jgi:polar amino acid transport system ATP-binding protein